MSTFGTVLIVLASFLGSYLLVLDERAVDWPPFLVALLVGAVGVGLRRKGAQSSVVDEGGGHDSLGQLVEILETVTERSAQLQQAAPALGVYALPGRIDSDLRPDIATFVEGREEISRVLGLRAYANIFSAFSAGERYLNRVWSASIDGYIDEATRSLERARGHLDEALELLRSAINDADDQSS